MDNKPIINVNRSFSKSKHNINNEEKPIKKPRGKKKVTIIEPEEEPEEPELKIESESEDEFPESSDSNFFI